MKQLNLNNNKPETAAKKLYDWCVREAEKAGQNKSEVMLVDPKDDKERGQCGVWRVMWESGPHEWAVRLTLGGSAYESGYAYKEKPEVLLTDAPKYSAQPYYSFDIGFYPE